MSKIRKNVGYTNISQNNYVNRINFMDFRYNLKYNF